MPKTPPTQLIDRIRSLSTPTAPQPTGIPARTEPLRDIRAVLFDIHGTLLVSDQPGEGLGRNGDSIDAVEAALHAAGWEDIDLPEGFDPAKRLAMARDAALASGPLSEIDHPALDIRTLWREPLADLTKTPVKKLDPLAVERFVIELECRINPTWPMPDLLETLSALRSSGRALGLLANSQFFTPLMFEALVGKSILQAGLEPGCRILSHEVGAAKPSPRLFEEAVIALENELAILSDEVLYLGSDLQRDIQPAAKAGFRTALFAGDARSLELGGEDITATGPPDRVLTDLRQLTAVLPPVRSKRKLGPVDLEADLDGHD